MTVTTSATPTSPRRVRGLALLTAFTLALAPQSARADDQVPFRAAFVTQFVSVVNFPIAHISVTGQGEAVHMGATTAVTTDQAVNLLTGEGTATYTLTAANGDTVVLALEVQTTFMSQSKVTFAGSYTVAGGTGRFAGATGCGSLTGSATFDDEPNSNTGVGNFTVTGTISSPGSLTPDAAR